MQINGTNRESRNIITLICWFLTNVPSYFNGGKIVFSTRGEGTSGHTVGERGNEPWYLSHHNHKIKIEIAQS